MRVPITLDVARLTFIDSTGVRTLYSLTGPPHEAKIVLRSPNRSGLARP